MSRAILVDPFSGVSGDMLLGALVDVGVPFDDIKSGLAAIPALAGVQITQERVTRGVFAATRVRVECPHEHAHRSLSDIRLLIEGAPLPEPVKRGAIDTFARLAKAEARVHGTDIEAVHFHEVGALDAIADIVGTHIALNALGNPQGYVRRFVLGSGTTQSAHGEIPLPAPATVELLAGHRVIFSERDEELVTPTGAAITSRFASLDPRTLFTPERVGYGAGSRERQGVPNVLRVVLGEVASRPAQVCIITSTIDDMNPEMYGYLMERMFGRGALEVYYNAVMMKKNRPGIEVTVIAEENDAYAVADALMLESTTLGVRIHREERVELGRDKGEVKTPYGTILVKLARRPDGSMTMSPEYESCRAAAESAGVPLRDVYDAALRAWSERK